jgi:hypothetical protein
LPIGCSLKIRTDKGYPNASDQPSRSATNPARDQAGAVARPRPSPDRFGSWNRRASERSSAGTRRRRRWSRSAAACTCGRMSRAQQAQTGNRSDASRQLGATSLSKQQGTFGRLSLSRDLSSAERIRGTIAFDGEHSCAVAGRGDSFATNAIVPILSLGRSLRATSERQMGRERRFSLHEDAASGGCPDSSGRFPLEGSGRRSGSGSISAVAR